MGTPGFEGGMSCERGSGVSIEESVGIFDPESNEHPIHAALWPLGSGAHRRLGQRPATVLRSYAGLWDVLVPFANTFYGAFSREEATSPRRWKSRPGPSVRVLKGLGPGNRGGA